MSDPIVVEVPDDMWEPIFDDEPGRLVAALIFNGCQMRLTAFEVTTDDQGAQVAVDPDDDEDFFELHRAFAAEGPYRTLVIGGRHYVVFADLHR